MRIKSLKCVFMLTGILELLTYEYDKDLNCHSCESQYENMKSFQIDPTLVSDLRNCS